MRTVDRIFQQLRKYYLDLVVEESKNFTFDHINYFFKFGLKRHEFFLFKN